MSDNPKILVQIDIEGVDGLDPLHIEDWLRGTMGLLATVRELGTCGDCGYFFNATEPWCALHSEEMRAYEDTTCSDWKRKEPPK